MKQAIAVLLLFICFAGCTQEATPQEQYSVDSLAIQSKDHVFSNSYKIFVKLSPDAFGTSNKLVLYKDQNKLIEQPLKSVEPTENNQIVFLWPANKVGNYAIEAVIEDANGTTISNSKTLDVTVDPLGHYELENIEASKPVETEVWCAQKITLGGDAAISQGELHLRSLVPTREGKTVLLRILDDGAGLPGNTTLASSSIASTSVPSAASWHSFNFEGAEIPEGTYWLVLSRDDTVGNIGWTYGGEEGTAFCKDASINGTWEQIPGTFAYKIQ